MLHHFEFQNFSSRAWFLTVSSKAIIKARTGNCCSTLNFKISPLVPSRKAIIKARRTVAASLSISKFLEKLCKVKMNFKISKKMVSSQKLRHFPPSKHYFGRKLPPGFVHYKIDNKPWTIYRALVYDLISKVHFSVFCMVHK